MSVIDLNNLSAEHNRLLNEISEEIKNEFHSLLEGLLKKTGNNIAWLTSSTFSRNNNQCDIFINLCHVLTAIKITETYRNISKIIVRPHSVKKILDEYFRKKGINVEIVSRQKRSETVRFFFRPYWKLAVSSSVFFRLWLLGSSSGKNNISPGEEVVLLTTFILKNSFDKNGKFNDRYYTGLLDNISADVKKNIFYLPHFHKGTINKRYFRYAAENENPRFVIKSYYLKLQDYLSVLTGASRRNSAVLKNIYIRDVKVDGIFLEDFRRHKFEITMLYGVFNYLFIKNLKENNIKIKLLVDWYENQAIDKGLIKGMKTFYPGTNTKGYAGYLVDFNYDFHLQPAYYEFKAGVVPDEICVMGKGLIKPIRKFCDKLKVPVVPAFRFRHVADIKINAEENRKKILAALPISYTYSLNLLRILAGLSGNQPLSGAEVNIKPHPALEINKLLKEFNNKLPANFKLVYGSFIEQLKKVSLLVGYNSSTCVEALAHGVPVIIFTGNNGLIQNPVPDSVPGDFRKLCFTKEELLSAINDFINIPDSDYLKIREIAEKIKLDYFEPVGKNSTSLLTI